MNGTAIKVQTPLSEIATVPYVVGRTLAEYHAEQRFPATAPVICVMNGTPTLRRDWGQIVAANDDVRFVVMPGGGFLNLLAQVAVTVGVTVLTGGNLTAGLAAGIVVGGLLNVLNPPKVGGTTDPQSPTYSIEAQGNSARLLQPIPRGYGLHNMFPDFASQPYTTYEGNDQILYQLFCLGLGWYDVQEIRIQETALWRKDTGYTDSFEDVQIEIVPPGSTVTLFPAAVQTSAEVSGADMLTGTVLGPFVANSSGTKVNKLAVDFVFPSGLYDADSKGKLKNRSVTVQVEIRPIDNVGTPLGPWVVAGTPVYSRATSTAQRFTESYPVADGRYQVRVTRLTPSAGDSDTSIQDKVQWAGLRAFQPSDNTYDNVTLLAVRIKATNQLSGQASRLFNVIQIAKLPIWNGATWSEPQPTRSIAWAAADMLRNPVYGEGRADSGIDLPKLLQLDAIWQARGDTFNGVFDTKRTFWESLGLLLAVGRTQQLLVGGIVTFMRDQPRSIAKGVFTPHNIRAGTFETTHILYDKNTPDDIIVEYQDERTWKTNEVQCSLDGSVSENPARIQLFGATNYAQAWREGIYQAAVNNFRRILGDLTSEMEGKLLMRGDAVIVSHDLAKWGTAGEVLEYDEASRSLYMSEPADWSNGPFLITLSDKRNRQYGPIVVTRGSDDYHAVFDAASLANVETEFGDLSSIVVTDPNRIPTRYTHGTSVRFAKRFIVSATSPQGFATFALSLTNDDPRVYTADQGAPPPEEGTGAGPGTNPEGPAIVGLNVSLDPSSETSPVTINVSWQPAAGATGYIVQLSYDGASYDTMYQGDNTSTSFLAQPNLITVRVAAVGSIRGPWSYQSREYSQSLVSKPTELSVSTATPAIITVRAPTDNSWYYVRLFKSANGAFAGSTQVGPDQSGALGQYFTVQDEGAAGTNSYFARAYDSLGNTSALIGPVKAA